MSAFRCFILVLFGAGLLAGPALAERRVAIAIGNANYATVGALKNPIHDATGVARALRELGFEVTLATDLDKANFEKRISAFANSLPGADAAQRTAQGGIMPQTGCASSSRPFHSSAIPLLSV